MTHDFPQHAEFYVTPRNSGKCHRNLQCHGNGLELCQITDAASCCAACNYVHTSWSLQLFQRDSECYSTHSASL